jgi:sulfur relay (sulfurtransferase) DsrF/TusC family protein
MKTSEEFAKEVGIFPDTFISYANYSHTLLAMRMYSRAALYAFAKELIEAGVEYDHTIYVKSLDKIK